LARRGNPITLKGKIKSPERGWLLAQFPILLK
jgi:hypothetical protein